MSFLFGGARKVNKDPVKDYQKELRHATRSMDREDINAANQEKVLASAITKFAKENKVDICKTKAKELVRLRAHRGRLATMKGHMSTLSQQLSTVQSAKVMQETMAKTTQLLRNLNTRMDAKAIHKMLLEYERQSIQFTDSQEVLEETLDGVFETENEQADTDQAVAGIFEELKLNIELGMGSAHDHSIHPKMLVNPEDLDTRLERLKEK